MRNIRIGPGAAKGIHRAVFPVFFLVLFAQNPAAGAEQPATAGQGEEAENSSASPYLFDLMNSPSGTEPAPPGSPSPLRETAASNRNQYFFELFYGRVSSGKASVSVDRGGVSDSREVSFGSDSAGGLRWRGWGGGDYKNLGFGLELWHVNQSAKEVSIQYVPITLQGMLRAGFLPVYNAPDGRLQVYGGFGFSFLVVGDIDIRFPESASPVSGGIDGTSSQLFLGAVWRFSVVGLFTEMRRTSADLDYSSSDQIFFGTPRSADLSHRTSQMVFGLSFPY